MTLAVVWGVAVVADSAQLSALVAEFSPRDHVGTALTVQTCSGFLLTMVSIRLVPLVAAQAGWQWAFLCLVPGPLAGAYALRHLQRQAGLRGRALQSVTRGRPFHGRPPAVVVAFAFPRRGPLLSRTGA